MVTIHLRKSKKLTYRLHELCILTVVIISEMKTGAHRYKYLKQVNGRGRYGEVEIEINAITTASIVTDNCDWKTLKRSYPDFVASGIENIWKQSAIKAAQYLIDTYDLPGSIEIKINDIVGIEVDTVPAHLGAAVVIGVFELLDSPLSAENIAEIDDFVTDNSGIELIPDYYKLALTKPTSTNEAD